MITADEVYYIIQRNAYRQIMVILISDCLFLFINDYSYTFFFFFLLGKSLKLHINFLA
jgi:hypothetical protein